ncbi:ALBINO3 chloroplastic isoform X2 [Micractinium conductrix]|uniref:ALBINO3 chloroplastic isoform X2 n=1 Tax=Micractinium conductrix TaxID=554055 RepID=A0A2P6VJ50_9CHLO|nr:ALBINO3 chloroplastic isoform X2 [Micractinium conductrix]|eukprot:PSC74090.1 ALBINO3 chloroplastic isoform X2 [Micractinium conductrix]
METVCARAEACSSGRRLERAQQSRTALLPARRPGRATRRHLRAPAALLGGVELDLPALAGGLAALPDALAAHLSLSSATAAHTAAAALENEQLTALLSLGDAAVQRFAELAEAAAVSAGDAAAAAGDGAATKPDNGWLQPLVTALETVLSFIEDGLKKLNVPYSYGWSIVGLTFFIKLATFPLTKKQVESALNIQKLKPQIDAIKAQYGDNKDAISRETNALYEKAGVDPLAGCLPSLATIPIFIGLFRSLSDFSSREEAGAAAFYWIPSLAGPTSVAAQKAGAGSAWLFPFVDGAPPIGWDMALRYVALPIALVIAQFISQAIVQPPQSNDDSDTAKFTQNLVKVLPLMIGWFALNVPSGLSLYYFSNTVFTSAQQIYLKKLGGASLADFDLGPIELGKARRSGSVADSVDLPAGEAEEGSPAAAAAAGAVALAQAQQQQNGAGAAALAMTSDGEADAGAAALAAAAAAAPAVPQINRRCKRRRRELLEAAA